MLLLGETMSLCNAGARVSSANVGAEAGLASFAGSFRIGAVQASIQCASNLELLSFGKPRSHG